MKNNRTTDQSRALTPSLSLIPKSYRLAIKSYEQIAVLFLLPALFSVLGSIYLGSLTSSHLALSHLTERQTLGLTLMLVWLIISIINFAPSIYFRVEASRNRDLPSLAECYKKGLARFGIIWLSEIAAYLLIAVGFICLIVPGILLLRRYGFSAYYAADNPKLKLKQIMTKSATETRPFARSIYATYATVIIINLILVLAFSGSLIGNLLVLLVGYGIMFIPVLRYREVSSFKLRPKLASAKPEKD